jgi:hypothetical protein
MVNFGEINDTFIFTDIPEIYNDGKRCPDS